MGPLAPGITSETKTSWKQETDLCPSPAVNPRQRDPALYSVENQLLLKNHCLKRPESSYNPWSSCVRSEREARSGHLWPGLQGAPGGALDRELRGWHG